MVNTKIRYIVYSHNGGGVRHHHFGVQNNIVSEANGQASPGDTINALGFPTQVFNGSNVNFAFMSVHGAADGNHLYASPGNQTVPVGSNDINILVVYAPPGGIGSGGGPGVWVDAFNIETGDFSDSLDFIKVLTPPTPPDTVDNAKTVFANQEGEVSTATAENIRANSHVDGVPFLEWKRITPTEAIISTPEIDLVKNETGEIWIAFYQKRSAVKGIGRVREVMEAGIMLWVGDDYCGNGGIRIPHGPGPQPGFKITIDGKVMERLSPEEQQKLNAYIKEYPEVAGTALTAMNRVTSILRGVSNILGGAKGRR